MSESKTKPLRMSRRKARLVDGRVVDYDECDTGHQKDAYPPEEYEFLGYGVPFEVDGRPVQYRYTVALFRRIR